MRTIKAVCSIALLASGVASGAIAAPTGSRLGISNNNDNVGIVALAHAQEYRHCHNIHTRTYCHKADRLPMNWPPLSDTPIRR